MRIHLLCRNKWLGVFFLVALLSGKAMGQSASFNFSNAVAPVTGWTNVSGDPSFAVRTATAPSGVTITSVATANWYPDGSGFCSYNTGGVNSAGFFPAAVLFNHWYQYGTGNAAVLNVSKPSLILGGLSKDSIYSIRISGSFTPGIPATYNMEPTQYAVMGATNNGTMNINGNANLLDGAIFNNIAPDSTGKIRIYLNTANGSNVATLSGLQIATGRPAVANLSLGAGLAQVGTTISLGDSISGLGPHSLVSNRYQYLNGHQYSFGGSVRDAPNHPVLRLYDNGDLAASTTMDKSINTDGQTGLRFYSKLGVLQIGATDHLDTTVSISNLPETWQGGGILVNSDNMYNPNVLKGRLYDSYVQGNSYNIDSTAQLDMVMLNGQNSQLSGGVMDGSLFTGYGLRLQAQIDNCIVSGNANYVTKFASADNISGLLNITEDSSFCSLVTGVSNQFGGFYQFVSGVNLINRTPGGAIVGSGNVDFSTLPYTGTKGLTTPGLAGYPLFALGNSSSNGGFKSNALTVLYNGRTQINTTGYSAGLTQTAVTPQAALDVASTNTGVLLPRLTTAQRNAIASGDLHSGLLLYNTDSSAFQYYSGSGWNWVGGGGTAGTRWLGGTGLVFDSVDNVAIGTSNPQGYKLAVNGTAIFTQAVVKPNANWPDYVFKRGYRLPGLEQLAGFIRTYHHLPGVPGEQEVAKNGIDIGAQQTALLKNVEELTLYLIRDNKTLREQRQTLSGVEDRLDAQQKEIEELRAMILKKIKK